MVLKFYGNTYSPSSKLVALVLREKQIPYEYVEVNLAAGEHKKPEYLAIQPFGLVPCINDDGFMLYESRAIARYLAEKYSNQGTQLIPSDPKKRALLDQAASVEAFSFESYIHPLIFECHLPKFHGGKIDPERLKQLTNDLGKSLDVYEKILSKQKYIAGDEFTLADLYHIPGGNILPMIGSDSGPGITVIKDRPNVAKWFNEISSRPSWQKVKDGLPGDA